MPGCYGAAGAPRPCHGGRHRGEEEGTGRFFLCERCRSQVLICRCCDRGQIYCAADCARVARAERRRDVAKRYKTSRKGRFAHAARSRRYRARHNKATHHGSPASDADVEVMVASVTTPMKVSDTVDAPLLPTRRRMPRAHPPPPAASSLVAERSAPPVSLVRSS